MPVNNQEAIGDDVECLSEEFWENMANLIEKGDLKEAEVQLELMVEKKGVSDFNKFLGYSSLGKCKRRTNVGRFNA